MATQLSSRDFEAFVREKRIAAIHFDAEWDVGHRPTARQKMEKAKALLGDQVNFGEVDCDREMELARSIRLPGVPAIAYYLDGELIAVLLGAQQNVQARLERVIRGEPIGYKDGTDTETRRS